MDGANVWLYYYNGTKPQRFNISYVGKGYYKIIAEHSGKALTVENDTRKAGVNVVQKKMGCKFRYTALEICEYKRGVLYSIQNRYSS
ncbi:MAG: RICIN domain-containing protein [[Ruminococcus] torques]